MFTVSGTGFSLLYCAKFSLANGSIWFSLSLRYLPHSLSLSPLLERDDMVCLFVSVETWWIHSAQRIISEDTRTHPHFSCTSLSLLSHFSLLPLSLLSPSLSFICHSFPFQRVPSENHNFLFINHFFYSILSCCYNDGKNSWGLQKGRNAIVASWWYNILSS